MKRLRAIRLWGQLHTLKDIFIVKIKKKLLHVAKESKILYFMLQLLWICINGHWIEFNIIMSLIKIYIRIAESL